MTTEMAEPAWQKSACILCECNCGLEIQVADGRLAKIRGDKEHASSRGYTCEKPAAQRPRRRLPRRGGRPAPDRRTGVSLNELTSAHRRDGLAGTPWHTYVPARVEAL
jgi:anaerobic selenocysteine-containing dehydrogenase